MATVKKSEPLKMTPTQLKNENIKLKEELQKVKEGAYCYMCDKHKPKEKFYVCTDPRVKSGVSRICIDCAKKIAFMEDADGKLHEPTKESLILSLKYLDKPFINSLYDSSIQESENPLSGRAKKNFATAYFKNIQMQQYNGLTFNDSDFFVDNNAVDKEAVESHIGQDTYDDYIKNKKEVIRLLNYDPFEKEAISDQPFLYSQLLGLLDSSEDANEDMMRTSSIISIVRGFLQNSKIDDTMAKLMSDISDIKKNSATIKSLQDSKQKMTVMITKLAEDNCISLKHNKNAKKGENTWTGKIKKIKDLNLREGEVNGFDMNTCRGMWQVMNLSDASIIKQLHLDESEYSDMLAEQRQMITNLRRELEQYQEVARILLRENLDLKDLLESNGLLDEENVIDLEDLFSVFGNINQEDTESLSNITEDTDSDGDSNE